MAITHGGDVFAIAQEQGWNWRDVLDFSANINPLGPSPQVNPAICRSLDRIVHYPEREPARLRCALAELWHLHPDQILLGNGATELIFFLARVLPQDVVTLALPAFSEWERAFPQSREADLTNRITWPTDGLLVLTRPSNPTGWSLPLHDLCRYLDSSSARVLIDESFLEFSGLPSAAALIARYPQVIVLRSLTKFYALPGMRVGALIADSALVKGWRYQREPWQVNVLAEEAALAAIGDADHARKSIAFVHEERDWLLQQIRLLPGTRTVSTDANFLFVRLDYPASKLRDYLLPHKILIRSCAGWPGISGEAVRVAIRPHYENERLLEIWRTFECA